MCKSGQFMFVDPVSPVMVSLINFHDVVMFLVIVVCFVVFNFIMSGAEMSGVFRDLSESQELELFWTVVPGVSLVFVGVPSFFNLYEMDEPLFSNFWVKIVAHQWYWNYSFGVSNYSNLSKLGFAENSYMLNSSQPSPSEELSFDSYMLPEEELNIGDYRVLEVDHRLVLPSNLGINLGVTSADVLHCWTVSGLGVKVDAVPGRINLLNFFGNRVGVYYGQCSELCGPNHSFMPIVLELIPFTSFVTWIVDVVVDSDE